MTKLGLDKERAKQLMAGLAIVKASAETAEQGSGGQARAAE